MPTLSFEGKVIHADALDRRELIRIAPSVPVTHLINRIRTYIGVAEEHAIDMTDLPDDKASVLLFAVSNGEATLFIKDASAVETEYTATKMIIGLDMVITAVRIIGSEAETVYDLILGANEVV